MTTDDALYELTTSGEGYIQPIDPRMDREPAGSLLLARAAAIRNAQHAAVRQAAGSRAAAGDPALAERVERELLPRSGELVHDRQVVAESRTDPSPEGAHYRVELRVVVDLRALDRELDRLRR